MVDFIRLTMPDMMPVIVPTKDIARITPHFSTGVGSRVQCYKQEPFTVLETPAEIGEMLGAACAAPPATEESAQARMHFSAKDIYSLTHAGANYLVIYLRQKGATVEYPVGVTS
jgi:hypothetical protein